MRRKANDNLLYCHLRYNWLPRIVQGYAFGQRIHGDINEVGITEFAGVV